MNNMNNLTPGTNPRITASNAAFLRLKNDPDDGSFTMDVCVECPPSEKTVTPVTDLCPKLAHPRPNRDGAMSESPVMFEVIDNNPGTYHCSICGANPATLKCTGAHDGPCCLQCAFSMLADLAQRTVDRIKRAG